MCKLVLSKIENLTVSQKGYITMSGSVEELHVETVARDGNCHIYCPFEFPAEMSPVKYTFVLSICVCVCRTAEGTRDPELPYCYDPYGFA
jgi:hypothetical protein